MDALTVKTVRDGHLDVHTSNLTFSGLGGGILSCRLTATVVLYIPCFTSGEFYSQERPLLWMGVVNFYIAVSCGSTINRKWSQRRE